MAQVRAEPGRSAVARLISKKTLIRAAVHVACWVPFITTIADSWRGPWRAVGDGARTALVSWDTLATGIPLVGQPNELPHTPHDLGPMQFWLLTIPVHIDTDRGVQWGAALLAMLAASLTVEAAFSVLGDTGGLLASVVVVATVAWFPGFAAWPYDTPNYGMVAAQAHLTYAAASAGLVVAADDRAFVAQAPGDHLGSPLSPQGRPVPGELRPAMGANRRWLSFRQHPKLP